MWKRIAAAASLSTAGLIGARLLYRADLKRADRVWQDLAHAGPARPETFSPDMVSGLPEPARRYFTWAIAPGTPLRTVAEIDMVGEIGLGDKRNPRYMPMRAGEILAPPHGFVWIPEVGSGLIRFSGSDGYAAGHAWTQFWLSGVLPITRSSSTPDLARSALARAIAEALWAPAALLPSNGVIWRAAGRDRATAIFDSLGPSFALTMTVSDDGTPRSVEMQRWSNANPERVFRWQPFGAVIKQTGRFHGFGIPTRIDGGNQFGTDEYFPFFRAQVTSIGFR